MQKKIGTLPLEVDIGWLRLGGKHAEAEATNRFGERVSVRLNDRGQIDRERRLSSVPR